MPSLVPYLNFDGTCRQALEFYAAAVNGRIDSIQTFGEAPAEMPAGSIRITRCFTRPSASSRSNTSS